MGNELNITILLRYPSPNRRFCWVRCGVSERMANNTLDKVLEEILERYKEVKQFEAMDKREHALEAYSSALDGCRETFSSRGVVFEEYYFVLYDMASLLVRGRQLSQAEELFQESLSLHRQQDSAVGIAEDYQELAHLCVRQKRYPKALYYYSRALECIPADDLLPRGLVYFDMVKPLYYLRRFLDALDCTQKVEAIFELMAPEFREDFRNIERRNSCMLRKLKLLTKKCVEKKITELNKPNRLRLQL